MELVRCRREVAVRDDVAFWLWRDRSVEDEEEQGERSLGSVWCGVQSVRYEVCSCWAREVRR